jgi:hypothetical protein
MSSWVKLAFAGLSALVLATAAPAAAQVPPGLASELTMGLDDQQDSLFNEGFAHAAGPLYGDVAQGRGRVLTVMLRADQEYTIAGVCDRRCGDIDLRLIDPRGQMIASDVRGNNEPEMHIRPNVTGQHSIQVGMIRCNAPTCWFAVNVYTRG